MTEDESKLAELRAAGVILDPEDMAPLEPPDIGMVNCNDVFAWACADCEPVTAETLPGLYAAWEVNPEWGPMLWVCRRRRMRPQPKLEAKMRALGEWTPSFEELPSRSA